MFAVLRILGVLGTVALLLLGAVWLTTAMPGRSAEPMAHLTLSRDELALRGRLQQHVARLAGEIGERNTRFPAAYQAAAQYVVDTLAAAGLTPLKQRYRSQGEPVDNLVATVPGTTHPSEVVVIGAHYDSVRDTPGADDNASGTAAVLELARAFAQRPQPRTLRFVLFGNEEPPAFQNDDMGSLVYAQACRAAGDDIRAMLSVESVGFYSQSAGSQQLPTPLLSPFLPNTGHFLAFVGNWRARPLVRRGIAAFRESCQFPSEGITAPEWVSGIGFSDHWSFWQVGYPAFMVTDTALFRNQHYHRPTDLPDTLDYNAMARVTTGLIAVTAALAQAD